jgi:hypothetical protein
MQRRNVAQWFRVIVLGTIGHVFDSHYSEKTMTKKDFKYKHILLLVLLIIKSVTFCDPFLFEINEKVRDMLHPYTKQCTEEEGTYLGLMILSLYSGYFFFDWILGVFGK